MVMRSSWRIGWSESDDCNMDWVEKLTGSPEKCARMTLRIIGILMIMRVILGLGEIAVRSTMTTILTTLTRRVMRRMMMKRSLEEQTARVAVEIMWR